MKTINLFVLLAGLSGTTLLAADAPSAPDSNAAAPPPAPAVAPVEATAPAPAAATATDTNADFPPDKGLRFNFKDAPLSTVLSYLSKAAGFIIVPKVSLSGAVTVESDQPLNREDALLLVEKVMSDSDYAVVRDGNILTVYSALEARRRNVPTKLFKSMEDIPHNSEVATWIIPVRTLNPVALVSNLQRLVGSDTDLQANESANALVITDSQDNIRRIADIVMKLDSVSSSINSIEVFPLKYADAKSLADLVKQLFPSADTSTGGRGGTPTIGGFAGRGGRGGGRGGNGGFGGLQALFGGGGTDPNGSTPQSRISAVSDDHSNSLIVSAPEDLIPIIRDLVTKLDQPVEDITEVKLFHLKYRGLHRNGEPVGQPLSGPERQRCQCPDRAVWWRPGRRRPGRCGRRRVRRRVRRRGGHRHRPERVHEETGDVIAVPDPRTQSLLVSASKEVMPQIEDMVNQLDSMAEGKVQVYSFKLANAEPQDVLQVVQDLFPQGQTSTRQNTTQNNVFQQRSTTLSQNFNSSGPGSGTTTSTSSGGTGGRSATGF